MWQIKVRHGPERRRRWNDDDRLRILAQTFAPGASLRTWRDCTTLRRPRFTHGALNCGSRSHQ